MRPKLEILIPTIASRAGMLHKLMMGLQEQARAHEGVKLTVLHDGPGPRETIGEKRARGIREAVGEYVAFIDDDDTVVSDYLDCIMPRLALAPDCVGLIVAYYQDGVFQSCFQHSLQNRENVSWQGAARTPHHLCPIRTELAQQAEMPAKNWGEDYAFAMAVLPLLRTEEFVGSHALYRYMFVSGKQGSVL